MNHFVLLYVACCCCCCLLLNFLFFFRYQESVVNGGTQQISQRLVKYIQAKFNTQNKNNMNDSDGCMISSQAATFGIIFNNAVFAVNDTNRNKDGIQVTYAPMLSNSFNNTKKNTIDENATELKESKESKDDVENDMSQQQQQAPPARSRQTPAVSKDDLHMNKLDLSGRKRINCDYVLFSVAPPMLSTIHFINPPLPSPMKRLFDKSFLTSYYKAFMFFDFPFWRAKDNNNKNNQSGNFLCGEILGDGIDGPLLTLMEHHYNEIYNWDTINEDERPTHYCLCLMNGALITEKWSLKTKKQREKCILNQLSDAFGKYHGPNDKNIVERHFKDFIEIEWINCGPTSQWPPGVLMTETINNKGDSFIDYSLGNIYFANTDFSLECTGYMEGAISHGTQQARKLYKRWQKAVSICKRKSKNTKNKSKSKNGDDNVDDHINIKFADEIINVMEKEQRENDDVEIKTGLTFWDTNYNKTKWFSSKKWKYIIGACAVVGGVGISYGYEPMRNFVQSNWDKIGGGTSSVIIPPRERSPEK